jgi:cytochrome P450
MLLPLEILLVASTAYVVYLIVSHFIASRRNAAKARQLGCEEPALQKNRYPLGIDNLLRAIAADKAKLFPVDSIKRTVDNGSITYKYTLLGTTNYFTADEKNIQTMLATGFNDWDLGANRRGNFYPLLGNGIFTQDGPAWQHSRSMMRPQFAREQVSDLDLEERHVQNMMKALDVSIGSDNWTECVDLQVLFFRMCNSLRIDSLVRQR